MKRIKGNLIKLAKQGQFDVIMHGCNCMATMGAGIAKQIATAWPGILYTDKAAYMIADGDPKIMLGTYSSLTTGVGVPDIIEIVNLYTQKHPGPCFELGYLRDALLMYLDKHKPPLFVKETRVGIPWIGAGLGGGDWKQIEPAIIDILDDKCDLTIVEFSKT